MLIYLKLLQEPIVHDDAKAIYTHMQNFLHAGRQ